MTVADERTLSELAPDADPVRIRRAIRAPKRHHAVILVCLAIVTAIVFVVQVLLGGSFTYTFPDALRIIFGDGIGRPTAEFLLMENKLPRALLGVLVGLCFGAGGAIFQTTLRNPLASPDVIGISMGASTAAVVALLFFGIRGDFVGIAAALGGVLTALLIRWVAGRGGGFRLVLVGVGIAAALGAVINYLFVRAAIWDAQLALRWMTGSLSDANWSRVRILLVVVIVLGAVLAWLSADLRINELGDDAAVGLGVGIARVDQLMFLGVLLVAAGVTGAGPVAFLAFLSGPIARALNRGRTSIVGAALVGAIIISAADFVGANLFGGTSLPVGVVTGAVGAPFLLYLMARGATGRTAR